MWLSNAAVRRPVAISCLLIALALLGLNAYRHMGLEFMPRFDLPFITVVTVYPGASPQEIETDIARRLEDAVMAVDGLKDVTTMCLENVAQTFLEFDLGVDVNVAAADVREQIDLIRHLLPAGAEDPQILKFDLNARPIITLALVGSAPIDDLFDLADQELKDSLTRVSGVAEARLSGGAAREVRIRLDRQALAARGLRAIDVVETLRRELGTIPAGRIRGGGQELSVIYDADSDDLAALGRLELAGHDGARSRLADIASITLEGGELRQMARLDGRPTVAIRLVKTADANTVRVVEAVRHQLPAINARLPGDAELVWVADEGAFIAATNDSAWINVAQGIALTAGVLFLFLYNLRSLFVVAISMPATVVIALFFMQAVGFTLNSSTLIAIGLSVGILVTNSIVVLEAIISRLDEGLAPREAARVGAGTACLAVLASAMTNSVVLFPLAVMPSMIGLWIQPLAITLLIMTVVSLFISFTLTPLLCGALLRPRRTEARGLLPTVERGWNAMLGGVIAGYRRYLNLIFGRRWCALVIVLLALGLLLLSGRVAGALGSDLATDPDKGEIFVKLEFPTRYGLERSAAAVAAVEAELRDLPELRHILSTVGSVDALPGQISEGVYLAQLLLTFSQRDQRRIGIDALETIVRTRLDNVPGALITVSQPSMVGGQGVDLELEIAGPELAVLDDLVLAVQAVADAIPGISDTDTTARDGKPELRLRPRRDVLRDLRLPATVVGLDLRAAFEGLTAGVYTQAARNYDIVVSLDEEFGLDQLEQMPIPGPHPGQLLALDTLVESEQRLAPIVITRKNKQRIAKLMANLGPGLSLGDAVQRLEAAIDDRDLLPPGYHHRFVGNYEHMSEAQEALGEAGLIAIVLVILALAAILESFRQPWLILTTLPLAMIGVIWALFLTGSSLGIFEIMAMVMLIGIVVNNAILIVDRANQLTIEGVARHQALIDGACDRFRPVLMITLAAILGMLPLALGRGIGAELRNGVGIASTGGIFASGILTMLVLPALFALVRRDT